MKKHDVQTIITALGGRAQLQALLGVGASDVSNYLARDELPQRAVGTVCAALRARGFTVDPTCLEIIGQRVPAAASVPLDNPHMAGNRQIADGATGSALPDTHRSSGT